MIHRRPWAPVYVLLLCLSKVAFGQASTVPVFDLERLQLNPAGRDGLLVGGGDVLDPSSLRVALLAHYEHNPLVVYDALGHRSATLLGSRITAHLTAAYGVTRWLEVNLQLPVVLWQGNGQNLDAFGFAAPPTFSVGTPWVQARAGLFRERDGMPLDLSIDLAMSIPLGTPEAFASDKGVGLMPRLGLGRKLGEFVRLAFEVGGWFRPSQSLVSSQAVGNSAVSPTVQLGLSATTLGPGARFELSLRGTVPVDGQPSAAELMAGGRFPVGPLELLVLGGPGFGRVVGTPLFRVLAGVSFRTPGDALATAQPAPLPQRQTRCLEGSEHDPVECPELDLDRDGIANRLDACPRLHGEPSAQGCPDADGDGVEDAKDQCPQARGPATQAGCPDTDQDGLHDGIDGCVSQAGPAALQGCPLADADGDGVPDAEDKCPAVAGAKSAEGCPPDRDADGVPDAVDSCIDRPGTKENDGCPTRSLVRLVSDRLIILDKVYFDTGKATIQARSNALLDSVAQVLSSHPEVAKVFIDGHTDDRGKPDLNRKLSLARGESVKSYLVKKGVAASRLEARGFGPDKPIADNAKPAGREQNRRVEFVIETGTTTQENK